MHKRWIYLLALILIAAAAGATILAKKEFKDHGNKTAPIATANKISKNRACHTFSLDDAKRLMRNAVKSNQNPIYESSSDLEVSTCTYTEQTTSAAVPGRKSASLLIRYPKTDKGALSNRNEFGPLRPAAVQTVSSYGDSAYWDPSHGQLNILKNDIWYVVSYGQAAPSARTLDQAKELANLLSDKL